jgi:hypothetical protein
MAQQNTLRVCRKWFNNMMLSDWMEDNLIIRNSVLKCGFVLLPKSH